MTDDVPVDVMKEVFMRTIGEISLNVVKNIYHSILNIQNIIFDYCSNTREKCHYFYIYIL